MKYLQTYRQKEKQVGKWTNIQLDNLTNGQTDKWTNRQMDKHANGQTEEWIKGWSD